MDITTANPTHMLNWSICGHQDSSFTIIGAATAASQQTIADGQSLVNGTELIDEITRGYTGTAGGGLPPTDPDGYPLDNHPYTKEDCMAEMKDIAAAMKGKTGDDLQKLQTKLNVWSTRNSLIDTTMQMPVGQCQNMNKALQSSAQQDQSNLQSLNSMGSSAAANITTAASLIQKASA